MATSTVVSLPQMVDLALNTPEIGIVNFSVLHSLLHVIVNQLNLSGTKVEFRGADSERIQQYICQSKPGTMLTLTEYTLGGVESAESLTEKGEKKKKVSIDDKEKGQTDESQKEVAEQKKLKPSKKASKEKTRDKSSSIILVETSKTTSNSIGSSRGYLDKIEDDIKILQEKVEELTELPANTALIEAMRSDEKTPVLDMYQILSLSKRLDAAEITVEKMTSMLEQFIKGDFQETLDSVHAPSKGSSKSLEKIRQSLSQGRSTSVIDDLEQRIADLERIVRGSAMIPPKNPSLVLSEASSGKVGRAASSVTGMHDIESVDFSQLSPSRAIEILKDQIIGLNNTILAYSEIIKEMEALKNMLSADSEAQPIEMRVKQLESKLPEFMEQINSLDNGFSRQMSALSNRIGDVEREVGEMLEKMHLLPDSNMLDSNITTELHEQLMTLQEELQEFKETVRKLTEGNENRQHSIDVLVEQIELLKTVKADREDLEDALADKADACQINRKVSFEQFDQACGDMSKSIEEALAKLSQQETLWAQALEDLQKDLGSKMDRLELNPLRDFINTKLKSLQEKFKTLTALKKEHEAAGTKSKYLRNVNCISCDKDVVMRKEMDSSLYPKPAALPPTRSMGPYLAYELDELRKQQKCLPNSKNLNMFENALQAGKSARSPDHICNRYCGGSHTITTPQQRVTRMGHFLEQWGPEISPVNDTHVRGKDGQMYKGRDDEALKQLAAVKPPTTRPDSEPVIHITGDATSNRQSGADNLSKPIRQSGLQSFSKPSTPKDQGKQ